MSAPNSTVDGPLRVGISGCLLGQNVRYDGGHKRDRYITDVLGRHFTFVPICPELEAGMGVPREPVRLVATPDGPRMIGLESGDDWTARMRRFAARRVSQLEKLELCGFILKQNSPSCGQARVKLHPARGGRPARRGVGLFARELMASLTLLPVEEAERLEEARWRENFLERVFAYHRLQRLLAGRWSPEAVARFHAAHAAVLLSHGPAHREALDRLVAGIARREPARLRARYGELFMAALAVPATSRKHARVLDQLAGQLRGHVADAARAEIETAIDGYRRRSVPLLVPLTLIRHFARLHAVPSLIDQVYLAPHPAEMMLRYHV